MFLKATTKTFQQVIRTLLLTICSFCIIGICKSQQITTVSKDSIGKVLQGTWRFDSLPGQFMTIEYKINNGDPIWKDHKDIVATIKDTTNKKASTSSFQIIPNGTNAKLSFYGYSKFVGGNPPNTSDTAAGTCLLMITGMFSNSAFAIKFPYEIKSISMSSLVLVDLKKSTKKVTKAYKLYKSK